MSNAAISVINNLKTDYAFKLIRAKRALRLLSDLEDLKINLAYDDVLDAIAMFYFYNSSYDAYERYSDIEEFKDALREEEMAFLINKFSCETTPAEIAIACAMDDEFPYKSALSWPHSYLKPTAVTALRNLCEFKISFDSISSIGDISLEDCGYIAKGYFDKIQEISRTLNEIARCAWETKANFERACANAQKNNKLKTIFLNSPEIDAAIELLDELIIAVHL